MNCPNCGKEINDTATFCPFCGQKIEAERNKQANPSLKGSSEGFKLTPAIIFAGVSLLLLFLIPGLGVVTSIVGILCGIIGMKKPTKKKWAKIGMIASVCLLCCCVGRVVLETSSQSVKNNDRTANNSGQNYNFKVAKKVSRVKNAKVEAKKEVKPKKPQARKAKK